VEAADPHRYSLVPFFDMFPVGIVELTAQIVTSKGTQVAASIDERLRFGDVVFLGETVEKRRHRVSPVATVDIHLQKEFGVRVDRGVELLLLSVYLDLFLVDSDPQR